MRTVGDQCEAHADGLRATVATYVEAEGTTEAEVAALQPYVAEER